MKMHLSVKVNALVTLLGSGALFSISSSMELWGFPSVCKDWGGVFSSERLLPNPRNFGGGVVRFAAILQLMGIYQ